MRTLILLASALLVACTDSSGPQTIFPVVAGDYRLERVNGKPLPFLFANSGAQLYAGRINLKADHSFTWSLCYSAQQSPCATEEIDQGTWIAKADTALLNSTGTNPQKRLTADSAETLRWVGAGGLDGYVLDYRRQ